MRAATFDWLSQIDDLEIHDSVLTFTMSCTNQYDELEQITAVIGLKTKTVEEYDCMNPENGHDIEVPCLKSRFCTVYDMDNVLAIENQPFELTAEQFRILGEYLDELVAA